MTSANNRKFISIYFEDGLLDHRRKRDLTVSFALDDPLYDKCKDLNSAEIKKYIGIQTYRELTAKADKEGRSLNNYIKYILRKRLLHE